MKVSDETQAKHLSMMLGNMWREMHEFATPFFKEYLKDSLKHVEKKQKKLEVKLRFPHRSLYPPAKPDSVSLKPERVAPSPSNVRWLELGSRMAWSIVWESRSKMLSKLKHGSRGQKIVQRGKLGEQGRKGMHRREVTHGGLQTMSSYILGRLQFVARLPLGANMWARGSVSAPDSGHECARPVQGRHHFRPWLR